MTIGEAQTVDPMIGLIGGLGVGAAITYYRGLAAAHDDGRRPLRLVMDHASISRATEYASNGDRHGLAVYLAGFLSRLKTAGATFGVIPAVTPHLCIDELKRITPLPVIDITEVVANHVRARKLSKVALFGTRFVIESDLYGRLRRCRHRPAAARRDRLRPPRLFPSGAYRHRVRRRSPAVRGTRGHLADARWRGGDPARRDRFRADVRSVEHAVSTRGLRTCPYRRRPACRASARGHGRTRLRSP